MERLLKGKDVALSIREDLQSRLPSLYEKGIVPTIAIVRVGENPSDLAYEASAIKKAKEVGVHAEKYICPVDIDQDDLIHIIEAINEDIKIHGILLFRPLPSHIDENVIRNAISPEKDLDCISDMALAGVFTKADIGFPPCTAEACMRILNHYACGIEGKKAVVIGRSMVIGRPVSIMLMESNATVTTCHTRTKKEDLIHYCKESDIIIAAAGVAGAVTKDMVSPGQTIIDVGINFDENGKMVGDVDFDSVADIVKEITPVPGGVGGVTTILLLEHLVIAAERQMENMPM